MATGNEQLLADYNMLKTRLERYPDITIIESAGDPPDQYELEYRIKGYTRGAGDTVMVAGVHRISLALPFGYPHFPPTVKPLTPIFHPDVDPEAIRIADFWEGSHELDSLVLHIGEMICGLHYNTADPFDQAAADWYDTHFADLPLDRLRMSGLAPDESAPIDTLSDDTFAALSLEDFDAQDESEDVGSNQEQEHYTEQIQKIRANLEQTRVFEASRLLADIPQEVKVPERQELTEAVTRAIQEGNKLHRKATDLEMQGSYNEALQLLAKLEEQVSDHPSLEHTRKRIRNTLELGEALTARLNGGAGEEKKAATREEKKREKKKSAPEEHPREERPRMGPPPGKGANRAYMPILAGVAVLLLFAGAGALYFKDNVTLKDARITLETARGLADKGQFADADTQLRQGMEKAERILLLRGDRERVIKQGKALRDEKRFQEGLAGRVEYDGRYIDKELAAKFTELRDLTEAAKKQRADGRKQEALAQYGRALAFAEKHKLTEQADQLKISIAALRLETAIGQAREAEEEKEWANAAKTYEEALRIARAMADKSGEQEIAQKLAAATFRHELDQSKSAFTGAQWQQTIDILERARKVQEKSPVAISDQEKNELERLLISSRLYQGLALAKDWYEQGKWAEAVSQYKEVLDILRGNADSFGGLAAIESSVGKIEKTLLLIQINQLQQRAALAEQHKAMDQAVEHYREITALIDGSLFSRDSNLRQIVNTANEKAGTLKRQILINQQAQWLMDNYLDLFRRHYPSTVSSTLQNPKAVFLEEKNGRMLFKLTCVERNQGSSFQLELTYQYDLASKTWKNIAGQ